MNCDQASNNKYFNCPAIMNDGRIFTDYRQAYVINDQLKLNNKKLDNYSYRQFLINNGDNLMKANNEYINNKAGCPSCVPIEVPDKIVCTTNSVNSLCTMNDKNGVGTRYVAEQNGERDVHFYEPGLQSYATVDAPTVDSERVMNGLNPMNPSYCGKSQ